MSDNVTEDKSIQVAKDKSGKSLERLTTKAIVKTPLSFSLMRRQRSRQGKIEEGTMGSKDLPPLYVTIVCSKCRICLHLFFCRV